ncbi:MAG: DNA-directed RNA polymerase subunit beta, partial [Edafosvirus sp.]
DLYFNRYGIMYSHLYNSFNQFLDENIKNFLKNGDNMFFEKITKDKVIRYKFEFDNISIRPPMLDNEDELMFPSDARNRNLTYAAKLIATVTQIQETVDIATDEVKRKVIGQPENEVPLANIPIMMRSKYCSLNIKKGYNQSECEYDPGGYYIVNGSEKVIISQERMCDNKPLVFIKKDSGSQIYTVQVNSRSNKINGLTQIITVRMKKDQLLNIRVPILSEIPVFILFRALGIESDKDIINYVVYDNKDNDMINLVRMSLDQSKNEKGMKIQTQEEALQFLVNKMRIIRKYSETDKNVKEQQRKMHLLDLLENNFIPHIEGNKIYKAFYLGYMINRLLQCYLGRIPADDRDSFVNKRIDLAGSLMEELFRQYYRKMLNECNKFFKKRNTDDENPLNIINQIKPNIIEQGLKAALLTGSWGRKKGVAQMLQRLTYLQTLSFLRRIDSPSVDASTSKLTNPRHLHPTQIGPMCPIETPEHSKVGLVKNLSMIGNITIMLNSQVLIIKDFLKDKIINLMDVESSNIRAYTKVFLNGEWVGMHTEPFKLVKDLRSKKLNGSIDATTSIIHDIENMEIKIFCDGGRVYRPVLRVENNEVLLKRSHLDLIATNGLQGKNETMITNWDEFMIKHPGVLEYIDLDEQMYAMIAKHITDVEKMRKIMISSIDKVKDIKNNSVINRYDDMVFVRYNYSEIHASFLIGIIATNIPFCNHNQGPRNIFQYAQGFGIGSPLCSSLCHSKNYGKSYI